MKQNSETVNKAHLLFKQGNYKEAKALYESLAQLHGRSLFELNLKLCDKRNGTPIVLEQASLNSEQAKQIEPVSAEAQLNETQRLLEHYYSKCKTLEMQLKATM